MRISQNYSKLIKKPAISFILIVVWLLFAYIASQLVLSSVIWVIEQIGVPISSVNEYILNAITSLLWYGLALVILVCTPRFFKKRIVDRKDMGLSRYLSWTDVLMAPAGFVLYLIITIALTAIATNILPWFDVNQAQDVGFSGINQRYEYIMAFITLVVIAPIAEELIFRGYLYGKLRKIAPIWLSALVVSVLFGFLHGAWNLAFDTFALSVVLCLMREFTGSIGTSILIHMIKNGLAYFFLFIYPLISATIK